MAFPPRRTPRAAKTEDLAQVCCLYDNADSFCQAARSGVGPRHAALGAVARRSSFSSIPRKTFASAVPAPGQTDDPQMQARTARLERAAVRQDTVLLEAIAPHSQAPRAVFERAARAAARDRGHEARRLGPAARRGRSCRRCGHAAATPIFVRSTSRLIEGVSGQSPLAALEAHARGRRRGRRLRAARDLHSDQRTRAAAGSRRANRRARHPPQGIAPQWWRRRSPCAGQGDQGARAETQGQVPGDEQASPSKRLAAECGRGRTDAQLSRASYRRSGGWGRPQGRPRPNHGRLLGSVRSGAVSRKSSASGPRGSSRAAVGFARWSARRACR